MNGMVQTKKAVVIGGSNGIGLALSSALIQQGYHVCILDIVPPAGDYLPQSSYTYAYCDVREPDDELVLALRNDKDITLLFVTVGLGRIADFEYLHPAEIKKTMDINATAVIRLISFFYPRIKSNSDFHTGVMGSIAGMISSPMFSVYAASKAAVCRFIESVNIELEANGYANRILNISPGNIKGTHFYGGENEPQLLMQLANDILCHLAARDILYIPNYCETYKAVIEQYDADPHTHGLRSYQYKKASGRAQNKNAVIIGYLSGTFDLFHIGHLNLLERAKKNCDYLIVGVHPNAAHKGKDTFIPFEERMAIVGACKYVDKVVPSCAEDSEAWEKWHFHRLFVGSDYKGSERFQRYEHFFSDKDVEIVYFPYTKETNSTQIRKTILLKTKDIPVPELSKRGINE